MAFLGKGNNLSVDKDDIAKYVDQLAVWHWLLGFEVDYGDRFCNPFRPDTSPKCYLVKGFKWDFLSDFAQRKFHNWTILHATKHKYGVGFDEACNIIWSRFGNKSVIVKNDVEIQSKSNDDKEHKCVIHFVPHISNNKPGFISIDRDFWQPLGISVDQLQSDYTYSLSMYRYNDKLGNVFQLYPNTQCYAYTFPSGNVKIYNPYRTIGKWVTNCTVNDIGFLDKLPAKGEKLFICKSYKDCRIQINLGYNAIWVQSEHILLPELIAKDLASRFKTIYVYYDNDQPGITASLHAIQYYNGLIGRTQFIPLWLPKELYNDGITDNAEYVTAYSQGKLKRLINTLTDGNTINSPP